MKNISVLILAAGKGVRMKSSLPKVLHSVGGTPMVHRVVRSASKLKPSSLALVVGFGGDQVKTYLNSQVPKLNYFTQKKLDGSGGAVRSAMRWLKRQRGTILVTCGDAPLLRTETFQALFQLHRKESNAATVLTTIMPDPKGYGRIVRAADGRVLKIVEDLDASNFEKGIKEINTGTYCFEASQLCKALPKLKANNKKKEFYLTDVLEILRNQGFRIGGQVCGDHNEAMGINSRIDLATAMRASYKRKAFELMSEGVTIIDPESTYIEDLVKVGSDTIIWPHTFIKGTTQIGQQCVIGPWASITNTKIKNNVIFQASFADDSFVSDGAKVGPYSRLRPKSKIGPDVHIGNFSEVKNSTLGAGTKVNHLSYLGDATIGKNVNIGAGSITCNYDGIKKSPTHIEDQAFIGSNANLIAPVRIGAHAVVGAGSSLSSDVPAWSLAVERSKTIIKKNWAKNKFKTE